jgi:hypothetical protein
VLNIYNFQNQIVQNKSSAFSSTNSYDNYFFSDIYSFNFLYSLCKPRKKTLEVSKKIFFVESLFALKKVEIEHHIIDQFPKLFKDKSPIFLFMYLIRHCENDCFFGTTESISRDLNQLTSRTLNDLALLEEYCLINITGKSIFEISINKKWNA